MIRLHEPTFGEEEIQAVVECMRSTRVTSGEKVRAFEKAFMPGSVACNSGSSANLLAISALVSRGTLKPGDEVIVSALSWSTTVWPLIQHGLVPVFVDCDRTLCISPPDVKAAITGKTRAIMPVHVYGNPCDMGELRDICRNLVLIEDCCEALGAEYKGRPVGTFGEVATFSFYYSHHITTMEGGMVVTQDQDLAETLRIQRAHGWVRDCEHPEKWTDEHPEFDPKFLFVDIGYNLRMTEPQAAMGLCQLPKLKGIVEKRRENMKRYERALPWLPAQVHRRGSSCFGFNFFVEDRDRVAKGLNAAGIETRPIIAGNLARQPALKRYPHRTFGTPMNADYVLDHGLSVGCHQGVTEEDIERVTKTLEALCGRA